MGFGVGVELSVVEQRYWAVLAALARESVTIVATQLGVPRQRLHTWLDRYDDEGLAGPVDRSHRPESPSHQSPAEVEAVCVRCAGNILGGVLVASRTSSGAWARRRWHPVRRCIGSWAATAWSRAQAGPTPKARHPAAAECGAFLHNVAAADVGHR